MRVSLSHRASFWLTIVKYLFALAITLFAFSRTLNYPILVLSLLELGIVFVLCNVLAGRSRLASSIVSGIFILLFAVQQFVLIFGNTFISLVMITNIDSLEDLSGKMAVYGLAVVAVLAFVCLPITHIEVPLPRALERFGGTAGILFSLFVAEALMLEVFGFASSPLFAYGTLFSQHLESIQVEEETKNQSNVTLEFYQAGVENHRPKPTTLSEQPNVVIIFMEGLSQHIVDDERAIMPNVAALQDQSLTFSSYFNHTFATYRGLTGQMHSGYQHNNFDDTTLVSMAHIFEGQGYHTTFINTEPSNRDFYNYLHTLGFSEVLDYPDEKHQGTVANNLSDRESFENLYEEMVKLGSSDQPFLLGIYTFGTHASLDSSDEKFGNGTDTELNKFYDADYQFGLFLDKFRNDPLFENTLLIFTADHCTYGDMYFTDAFPTYERPCIELDTIPFIIYHRDIQPEVIDVAGRNSLDFAPTVLDYLDLTGENYFLGTSLFAPNGQANQFETYFTDGGGYTMSTYGGRAHKYTSTKANELKKLVWRYYAAKKQEPLTPQSAGATPDSTSRDADATEVSGVVENPEAHVV